MAAITRLPAGTRVVEVETGQPGVVRCTYNDREGAMWVEFDSGRQWVLYPEEVEVER